MRSTARVVTGLSVALIVAALVKVAHVITPASFAGLGGDAALQRLSQFGYLVLVTVTQQALFVLPLALIATAILELNRARGLVTYALLGVIVAMAGFFVQMTGESDLRTIVNNYALRAYMIEGFFAGVAYWLVAGRFAGWRRGGAVVRARPFPLVRNPRTVSDAEDAEVETTHGRARR